MHQSSSQPLTHPLPACIPCLQTGGNVRIGQRFKQVSRLLLGEMVQHEMKRFKLMSWAAVFVVLLVTVIGFITMYVELTQVQSGVEVLNTVGECGLMRQEGRRADPG